MASINRIAWLALALAAAGGAHAADLYSQDFETNTLGVSGAGFLYGSGGYGALGFGNQMFRNWDAGNPAPSTVVSFSANAAAAATLQFDLAVIDSWDGNASIPGGCCNTDLFSVKLDGQTVFSADFNNVWSFIPGWGGPDTQTFPRDGRQLAGPVADLAGEWNGSLGYDSAYRLTVALGTLAPGAHTLEFHAGGDGWQAFQDESFAIDNLRVSAVPEPQAWLLLGLGLAAFGLGRRRR